MSNLDIAYLRSNFPMLNKRMHGRPLIYFDSAATTHKPKCVIDEMNNFYRNSYATVHRAVYELAAEATSLYETSRQKIQKFINAAHFEEVIFTKGTTESINLVASSFGRSFFNQGDEILICETEHHSNIVPWQLICAQTGAVIKVIPCNMDGEVDLDIISKMISDKSRIIAIAHIANTTGTVHPIKEITALAHEYGVKVLVDAAQSISHIKIDVQDLDVDFLAFSGHKAYGPTGIGILYGKKALLEVIPPYQGGGDMVDKVEFISTTYQKPPLKFEAGTPLIQQAIGLGNAIDFIESIGLDNIAAWENQLLSYATSRMKEVKGLKIIGNAKEKGAIVSFIIEGVHPLDLGTMLSLKGVAIRTGHLCAQPALKKFSVTSLARVSFGIYNTMEEIDNFIELLEEVLLLLRPPMSY
ncbi:MAG: SufS family cysteine desulfurase [Chlamydiae bacterium]|nr:SufS family cysteine desulfurase [Chlamydiota bacterium]